MRGRISSCVGRLPYGGRISSCVVSQLPMLGILGLIPVATQLSGLVAQSCHPATGGQGYGMVRGV